MAAPSQLHLIQLRIGGFQTTYIMMFFFGE